MKPMKKEKICIFEVDNTQRDYALCLQFIKINENETINTEEKIKYLRDITEKITISIGDIVHKGMAKKYLEIPNIAKSKGKVGEMVSNQHKLSEHNLDEADFKERKISYHIRVHLTESEKNGRSELAEFINLQYLALLMRSVFDFVGKRLSVFIVPYTGSKYPFVNDSGKTDTDAYMLASQFLRLLSKEYMGTIFGISGRNSDDTPIISALDFKRDNKYQDFFPVVIINKDKYENLFDKKVDWKKYQELVKLPRNWRIGDSRDDDPSKAYADAILETAIARLWKTVGSEDTESDVIKSRLSDLVSLLGKEASGSLMQFCLFAFMLYSVNQLEVQKWNQSVCYTWHLAKEICQGIKQVVQNSVQHSINKECFFSFYLHRSLENESRESFCRRIGRNYPDTILSNENDDGFYEALEIYIADVNEKDSMIINFRKRLEKELEALEAGKFLGHEGLRKGWEKIAVRNFFSEFKDEDLRDEWMLFRQEDLVAHVGLSLFALTAEHCKASVKVSSSTQYKLGDAKNYFYRSYSNPEDINDEKNIPDYIIPGTQFSILLPLHEWEENDITGLGQLEHTNKLVEDYSSFAGYIKCEERKETTDALIGGSGLDGKLCMLDAEDKFQCVIKWLNIWKNAISKNIHLLKQEEENKGKEKSNFVFQYDFKSVENKEFYENQDTMEVCFKGLLGALEIISDYDAPFLFALTNIPEGKLDIFKKICILLGVKDFPENLQLFLCECNHENMMICIGKNYVEAIFNSYIFSLEHGMSAFEKNDYIRTMELRNKLLPKDKLVKTDNNDTEIKVFPFDAVLKCDDEGRKTFFEEHIEKIVDKSLDQEKMGYKLENTHMRLGSKVHIHTFYEMSFLFYRTTVANRMAYLILRRMIEEKQWDDIYNEPVIFYGYASYSKAILTSITEILRIYREQSSDIAQEHKVGFASYQHNLYVESEKIQIYFGLPDKFPGKVVSENKLQLNEMVKIVQIVPISTTLTTFDKMWSMFSHFVLSDSERNLKLSANYTMFWVVDKEGDIEAGKPSNIESAYWEKVIGKQKIKTNFSDLMKAGYGYVDFFIYSAVGWEDPLKCKLCYPDAVIDEIPLVETDPTSSIPAQQIRHKRNEIQVSDEHETDFIKENNRRLLRLKGFVLYGHIRRRQNHFQYYIDTQGYFYEVKEEVKEWLKSRKNERKLPKCPKLHIIFSPEHNTNVGFAQYVNTYYFNGLAEIISFNVDKEFRSNFVCEHAALIQMIEKLHQGWENMGEMPVEFYFVDDTIVTGETFEKANSFMHSLIPEHLKGNYPANLFGKVFLLVDRLSKATKHIFVDNVDKDFLSFLHIDVSNVRTQGDSCIGCKLEQNAKRMFKRSATKSSATYWADKLKNYQKVAYDNRKEIEKIKKDDFFNRLVVSHILQNVIINSGKSVNEGQVYDVLLNIGLWMMSGKTEWNQNKEMSKEEKNLYGYKELMENIRGIEGFQIVLKVICRPFFSYDFKIRTQVLTFFVFLSELYLGENASTIADSSKVKLFIKEENRTEKTIKLADKIKNSIKQNKEKELEFLQNYLYEGLTDMGSTYLMRKQTMIKTYQWLEGEKAVEQSVEKKAEFWEKYAVNIFCLLTNNADETKEIWMEYLYLSGEEHNEFVRLNADKQTYEPKFLFQTITGKDKPEDNEHYFYQFCHELFLQSTGTNFDGVEKIACKNEEITEDKYFMKYWKLKRNMEQFQCQAGESVKTSWAENELFHLLEYGQNENKDEIINEKDVEHKYEKLLSLIRQMVGEKYGLLQEEINVALVTESIDENAKNERIQGLDIVKELLSKCDFGVAAARFEIKSRIADALEKKNNNFFELEKNGYMISELDDKKYSRPYIIIFFDNPNLMTSNIAGRSLKRIERVFLYLSIGMDIDKTSKNHIYFYLRFILRDILTFRNRILRFLEKDFAGDIFAKYARTVGEKNILSHEKANSHNTTADDEISVEIFVRPEILSKYKVLKENDISQWLLLRNYNNGQIAKIFNRSFQTPYELAKKDGEVPELYLKQDKAEGSKALFKKRLDKFNKLGMEHMGEYNIDRRFQFLKQIVNIKGLDELKNAEFIKSKEGFYYNLEYFKCILIDICMSAIKYKSDQPDYLLRVDKFLDNQKELEKSTKENNAELIKECESECCRIEFFRKESEDAEIDYLVIRNKVNKVANNLVDWREQNHIIEKRLKDPLDYVDGHMSMLAIKRYIENLCDNPKMKCQFEYLEIQGRLFFETRLPVLKREER